MADVASPDPGAGGGDEAVPKSQQKMRDLSSSLKQSMEADRPKSSLKGAGGGKAGKGSKYSSKFSSAQGTNMSHDELVRTYGDLQNKYDQLVTENDKLIADMKKRQESYVRREKQYQTQVNDLKDQLNKALYGRGASSEDGVFKLKNMHGKIIGGIGTLQSKTAKILQEQERDLLRAFRARLYDVQLELEKEKVKKNDGSSEWIEKTRALGKELDWTKEEALRLDRINQLLSKENNRLKTQFQSQEDDREFLVRQLVNLKKENARLRIDLGKQTVNESPSEANVGASTSGQKTPRKVQSANAKVNSETESRYREIIKRLKRLLEVERKNLRSVRTAYANELQSRTELEGFLRQCIDDVKQEITRRRTERVTTPRGKSAPPQRKEVDVTDFAPSDRERVLELLLSQDRVLGLLYEKTFPPRQVTPLYQPGVAEEEYDDVYADEDLEYEDDPVRPKSAIP